jgi:hypothetical protein
MFSDEGVTQFLFVYSQPWFIVVVREAVSRAVPGPAASLLQALICSPERNNIMIYV